MNFAKTERLAVFIDGPELRATVGGMGIDVDFKKVLAFFQGIAQLVKIQFYHIDRDDEEEASLRPLTDWLEYNGYSTVACSGRENETAGRRGNKNFLNVRLTVDALEIAPVVDHIVLFSGDAVLGPLIDALKWRGRRVSVVSTLQLRPPMVADELRRKADQFIDIADIVEHVAKDLEPGKTRKAKTHRAPRKAKQDIAESGHSE